jgi:hypothetical protein
MAQQKGRKGGSIRNSQHKSIGAVPESMIFGSSIDGGILDHSQDINKNHASAELLRRNMGPTDNSKHMYSMEDMLKRTGNPNSHSIQDL